MSNTQNPKSAKAATLTLIEGESAIIKFLDSVKSRGASLQRDCHIAACSVLAHVGKHSDVRLITRFLESLPDMTRKNAVKAWFENFGPVTFGEQGAVSFNGAKAVQLSAAMGKPFWAFKPEVDYVPMDVAKSIDSLIKKLERDSKETQRDHSAMVAKLLAMRPEGDETTARDESNAETAENVETANAAPADKPARTRRTATPATTEQPAAQAA
ncbi:hypothetical protein [Bradyrhizobium sp. SZCCHNS3053]|uniref:hypothetical protein n=1 Tax=Bradyrhizobium sp. SZCCHNS3053 TaxID=3057322 RepID=UPI002915C9E5|nr:hypothetical protein [Bradyrhizobium sp. SZCCHNS3053]